MADKRLVSYIQDNLKKGYDINTLRKFLFKSGYAKQIIEGAIKEAYSPTIKHEIHLSKSALIGISIFVIGLIIASTVLIFRTDGGSKQLLDLNLDVITKVVEAEDDVEFNVNLVSFGTDERYDVVLNYNIVDDNNKIITFKTETAAVETRSSIRSKVNVPSDISPGNYMLKVIANYNDQSATASDSFRVVEKSVSTAPVELDCDDNDVCTRDSIVEGRCAYDVISPCCGDDVCEGSEDFNSCSSDCEETVVVPSVPRDVELPPTIPSLERARELAERNPNSAVNYCNGLTNRDKCYAEIAKVAKSISYCEDISDEDDRDECYSDIADIKGDSDICKSVVSSATKDICFMNFVSDGDYTVCGELTLNYLKSSCIQMKRISELRP